MYQEKLDNNINKWPLFHAFMVTGILAFFMVCPVAPIRWNDLYISYGKIAIISTAAIYFFMRRLSGSIEVKLVIFYTIWLFITRLLNTDLYMQNDLELVISRILCCVVMPTGMLLSPAQRQRFLDVVIAIICAFYLVVAILGIYACFLGIYFYLPPENTYFGIVSGYMLNTSYFVLPLGTNRTISAVWFYICLCMMVYEFFRCRSKLWRIPIVITGIVFYIAVALSSCRSIMLAVCGNVGMLALLIGMEKIKLQSRALRALVLTLLVIVAIPVTYKSFDAITVGTQVLYDVIDPDVERTSAQFILSESENIDPSDQTGGFGENRDLGKSISTMSNRGNIYSSIIPTLKADPGLLLTGKYVDKLMDIPNLYQNFPYFHMHNYLVQTLMLTGVIGLLLVAAFTVFLVIRMLRLFFSTHPSATLAVKSLTLPLSGILVYGMFETVIFTNCADERAPTDIRELMFFILAGILLAWYYDIYPLRKKEK